MHIIYQSHETKKKDVWHEYLGQTSCREFAIHVLQNGTLSGTSNMTQATIFS